MKAFIAILLLGLFPLCTTLDCYNCISGDTGCNDPFNAAGSGVTQSNDSSWTYCVKESVSSVISRFGDTTCPTVSGATVECCEANLCNGAHGQYQISILLALSVFIILIKFK